MCQYDSDLLNTRPPSLSLISFSFFHSLSASFISNCLSNLLFSSFFSYIIYHCLLSLSLPPELAPHMFPLNHSFPLLLSSSISHSNFHRSPRPPPSRPLAHLMKQNAPLIAPLLIYRGTERTGQPLKGVGELQDTDTFVLIAQVIGQNVDGHHAEKLCSKASVSSEVWYLFQLSKTSKHEDLASVH